MVQGTVGYMGFLTTYREELKLLESKGFGKFNKNKDDFEVNMSKSYDLEVLFKDDKANNTKKYIENILIDWIVKNDIEMLNEHYNLSFKIVNMTKNPNTDIHKLITAEDKEAKQEAIKLKDKEIKELYKELDEKLKPIGITAKVLRDNKFTDSEIKKIIEKTIHHKEINKLKANDDKVTAIRFYLMPKKEIINIALLKLAENPIVSIADLDNKLQQIYITKKRKKAPYKDHLVSLFTSEIFNDSMIEFKKTKRINGKLYYNMLSIKNSDKKAFDKIKIELNEVEKYKKLGIELIFE